MKTKINFWFYIAHFFVEWEIFRANCAEGITTHSLCSIIIFLKSRRLWDNMEEYRAAGQATDENTAHAHCMLDT